MTEEECRDKKYNKDRILSVVVWALIAATLFTICCVFTRMAEGTVITGTLKQGGQPLTGYVDINLVYPGSTGSGLALPSTCPGSPTCHIPVYNGNFPTTTIEGNDTLLPRGTYYQITYYDAYNAPIARMPYVITGATYDLGAAVPTPVTTSNINFLDLLGLRSLSVNNLIVNNSIQIGNHGAIFSQLGITGAQQFNDSRWTNGFLTNSTTCGVQEAINSLGAGGGTVYLASGSCTITSGITISAPVNLIGMGTGVSTLVNGAGAVAITVRPNGTGFLIGPSLRSFTIQGAGSGSGLDDVVVNGSTGGIFQMVVDQMEIMNGHWGVFTTGLVQSLSINRSYIIQNDAGVGLSGTSIYTSITGSTVDTNVVDNIQISGSTGATTISGTTANDCVSGNGLDVVAGTTSASVHIIQSQFSDNLNAGVLLNDGSGHTIDSSQFQPGAHQHYGVYINTPSLGDAFTTQVTLKDNLLSNSLTADVFTSASPTYVLIYPQSEQNGSSQVVYTLTDPTKVHFVTPTSAFVFPPRVCNSNGCSITYPDGTIHAWGTTAGCNTGGGSNTCTSSVTFPVTFTATPIVVPTCISTNTNCLVTVDVAFTTGFTAGTAAVVRVNGSGSQLTSTINWTADGN